jgi:hypothetical protein
MEISAMATTASGKETSLAALASGTLKIGAIASDLNGDPRLVPERQDAFWFLRENALRVSIRFDGAWTRIVERDPPSETRLAELAALAVEAVSAISKAAKSPTAVNLLDALAKCSTSLDQTDAMIDSASV